MTVDRSDVLDQATSYAPRFFRFASPSFALVDLDGTLLATSKPDESASITACARAMLNICGEGDVAITNDPLVGSPHVTVFSLLVRGPQVAGVVRARTPDVGGFEIGGFAPQSFDTWGEGVRFIPIRTRASGRDVPHVRELLAVNSRTPRIQRTTIDTMQEAAEALVADVSPSTVLSLRAARRERAAALRTAIGRWTPGSYRASGAVQRRGEDTQGGAIRLSLTVTGQHVTFDLNGSDPQGEGPYNSPLPISADACTGALADLLETAVEPAMLDMLTVRADPGLVVSAVPPASTALGRNVTSVVVHDIARLALSKAAGPTDPKVLSSTWSISRARDLEALVSPDLRMRDDLIAEIKTQELALERATTSEELVRG